VAVREQADAQAGCDHVLDQVEAVCLVGDARGEAGHGGERTDDVLVRGVAGVADPVVVPEAGEGVQRRWAGGGFAGGRAEAPPCGPERRAVHGGVGCGGGEVVVVDQRQIGLVGSQQLPGLGWFVLADQHADPRMGGGETGDDRQQVGADGGGEPGDPQGPVGFCFRSQVELRGLDCAEDRDRMLGQPAARRGQPDPASGRLDERGAHLAGEHGDLL
jgi:hypothetical protein